MSLVPIFNIQAEFQLRLGLGFTKVNNLCIGRLHINKIKLRDNYVINDIGSFWIDVVTVAELEVEPTAFFV
jgi:hypothetical protein